MEKMSSLQGEAEAEDTSEEEQRLPSVAAAYNRRPSKQEEL
jgi:hypothetical protein